MCYDNFEQLTLVRWPQKCNVELIKGEKLEGTNYEIYGRKIYYLLNDIEVLETIRNAIVQPEEDTLSSIDVMLKLIKAGLRRILMHASLC